MMGFRLAGRGWMLAAALPWAAGCLVAGGQEEARPSIVPAVLRAVKGSGELSVKSGDVVGYPGKDAEARFAAVHLVELLQRTSGLLLVARPDTDKAGRHAVIRLELGGEATANGEGYDLDVDANHVTIRAAKDAGLYYGTVSLWQLLTAKAESKVVTLECVQIHDEPQMRWRGVMLDSARHMQPVESIRQMIDWMSLEKLNVLHWHLTDDQGWRLEIKRYPKLTSVGGYRELASEEGETDPATGKAYPKYGGFYTQEQVRALVAYAAERNVTIVPEIEMPGHASAALAAYPEFGAGVVKLTAPANHYGIFRSLYNVNDATFTFLENVLTEVMELFPSEYIHVGGDEAVKDEWKASPAIQAEMKALHLANEDELQSYFIKRIDTFLTAHHRRTLGWDEILQGGLAPNAAVMSWHGVKGAVEAAKQGHDAVLTPVRPLYFNYRQSDAAAEAPGRWALNTLADVYKFDPAPETLTVEERKHLLGVQANIWTEYLITPDRVTWMLFPRSAALAEIGWSAADRREWTGFEGRLVTEMERYKRLGIGFDPQAFRPQVATVLSKGGGVAVSLANQTGFGTIRYTTDGTSVSAASAAYAGPLSVTLPAVVKAATFGAGEGTGGEVTGGGVAEGGVAEGEVPGSAVTAELSAESVRRRYSQELKLCSNEPAIAMEQDPATGKRPVMLANYHKPCWIYKAAELAGVGGISVEAVAIPYVFQDGAGREPVMTPTSTPHGELEVHLDTCGGKLLASIPFGGIKGFDETQELKAALPSYNQAHDLCLVEVRPALNPLWVLNWVQLDAGDTK